MTKHTKEQDITHASQFAADADVPYGYGEEGQEGSHLDAQAKEGFSQRRFLRILFFICAFIVGVTIVLSAALQRVRLLPKGVYEARLEQQQALEEAQARETQEAQQALQAIAQAEPTAHQEVQQTPEPQAQPTQAYQKTALVVDGDRIGVLASVQAATELLEEVKAYYISKLTQEGVQGKIEAEFQSEVSLKAAEPDEETVTADALLQTLTSEKTPLKVICTVTEEQRETLAYKTKTEDDKYLLTGTKRIESMGMQGEKVTVSTSVYVNGKKKSSGTETQTNTVIQPQDALIRVGAQRITTTREPGRSEGKEGPETALTFVSPIEGNVVLNYGQSGGVLHLGLDYVPKDEAALDVVASCAGEVVCVMERGGYGLMVEIDHGEGFVSRYAHLGKANVTLGQHVAQGEVVGQAGQSGNASEVQLHFELRIHGEAYNPRYYLNK